MNNLFNYIILYFLHNTTLDQQLSIIIEELNRRLKGKVLQGADDYREVDNCIHYFSGIIPNIHELVSVRLGYNNEKQCPTAKEVIKRICFRTDIGKNK